MSSTLAAGVGGSEGGRVISVFRLDGLAVADGRVCLYVEGPGSNGVDDDEDPCECAAVSFSSSWRGLRDRPKPRRSLILRRLLRPTPPAVSSPSAGGAGAGPRSLTVVARLRSVAASREDVLVEAVVCVDAVEMADAEEEEVGKRVR